MIEVQSLDGYGGCIHIVSEMVDGSSFVASPTAVEYFMAMLTGTCINDSIIIIHDINVGMETGS